MAGRTKERLWIEVQHLSPADGRRLREAERIGRELGVPLVATNNVHFLRPEEHFYHRAVNAVRTGGLLTTVAAPDITTGEAWFKPAAEMERRFFESARPSSRMTRVHCGEPFGVAPSTSSTRIRSRAASRHSRS